MPVIALNGKAMTGTVLGVIVNGREESKRADQNDNPYNR